MTAIHYSLEPACCAFGIGLYLKNSLGRLTDFPLARVLQKMDVKGESLEKSPGKPRRL